jgi:hypothetical protein
VGQLSRGPRPEGQCSGDPTVGPKFRELVARTHVSKPWPPPAADVRPRSGRWLELGLSCSRRATTSTGGCSGRRPTAISGRSHASAVRARAPRLTFTRPWCAAGYNSYLYMRQRQIQSRRGKRIGQLDRDKIAAALKSDPTRRNSELARAFGVNWHTIQLIRQELEGGRLIQPYRPGRGRPPKLPDLRLTPSEAQELFDSLVITVWVTASYSYRGSPIPVGLFNARFDPEAPTDREELRRLVEKLASDLLHTWIAQGWPLKRAGTPGR